MSSYKRNHQSDEDEDSDDHQKRAKVARACVRCKAAKTCCDTNRPCKRCVRLGAEDQCKDAEQRKPGRKRKNSQATSQVHSPVASPKASPPRDDHAVGGDSLPIPAPPASHLSSLLEASKAKKEEEDATFNPPYRPANIDSKHALYLTPETLPNPETSMFGSLTSTIPPRRYNAFAFTPPTLPNPENPILAAQAASNINTLAAAAASLTDGFREPAPRRKVV